MKIAILRDNLYSPDEEAWLSINGAVFLEEFRRRNHDAFKLMIDDTGVVVPKSPFLRVSSRLDRISPTFWKELSPDIVLYYGSQSPFCIRTLEAIRSGAPPAFSIFRVEGFLFPERLTPALFWRRFRRNYVCLRHCPTEGWGFEERAPISAFARALAKSVRAFIFSSEAFLLQVARHTDVMTFFFPRLVDEWKAWFHAKGYPHFAEKCKWSGTPVRPSFHPLHEGTKKKASVISIAKWRHFTAPELTAAAMALVLRERPEVSFTIIGTRSDRVSVPLLAAAPETAPRVHVLEYLGNGQLPVFLAENEVFLSCSWREGIPGALSEALCCGCSLALASGPGVESFRDFVSGGDGTQAQERSPRAMADAVERELDLWKSGRRTASTIASKWESTHIGPQCDRLLEWMKASAT